MASPRKKAPRKKATAKVASRKKSARKKGKAVQKTARKSAQSEARSKLLTPRELFASIFAAFGPDGNDDLETTAKSNILRYLRQWAEVYPVANKYNLVFLHDETRMVTRDADDLYTAVTQFTDHKPLLLILHSYGGFVGPAYLIGKLLQEHTHGYLDIVVPRRAKSGATLLCCAADHIHMGGLSELGPIDPQIKGLPALGLKSSIEHIAELVAEYPHATDLFAKYMSQSIRPIDLGYYERVAESAAQYAERLLRPHKATLKQTPAKIAHDLVYSYKDHSFVIDKQEAQDIFGEDVVKHNTEEYKLGNSLYQALVYIGRMVDARDYDFYMIGSLESTPVFHKRKS